MSAIWKTVGPILLLQIAVAAVYLLWPVLRDGSATLARLLGPLFPVEPDWDDVPEAPKQPFRGKWRDAEYARSKAAYGQREERFEKPQSPNPSIPSQRETYLAELGLSADAGTASIKRAYRKGAKTYHPDKFVSAKHSQADREQASEKMLKINETYDWLSSQS